jgi:hypothetical protein
MHDGWLPGMRAADFLPATALEWMKASILREPRWGRQQRSRKKHDKQKKSHGASSRGKN